MKHLLIYSWEKMLKENSFGGKYNKVLMDWYKFVIIHNEVWPFGIVCRCLVLSFSLFVCLYLDSGAHIHVHQRLYEQGNLLAMYSRFYCI